MYNKASKVLSILENMKAELNDERFAKLDIRFVEWYEGCKDFVYHPRYDMLEIYC